MLEQNGRPGDRPKYVWKFCIDKSATFWKNTCCPLSVFIKNQFLLGVWIVNRNYFKIIKFLRKICHPGCVGSYIIHIFLQRIGKVECSVSFAIRKIDSSFIYQIFLVVIEFYKKSRRRFCSRVSIKNKRFKIDIIANNILVFIKKK